MTQPKIEGVGHGVPRTIFGSDGSNWYAVLVDSDGHVKIDIVGHDPVPSSPVNTFGAWVLVPTATTTTVVSYTVTTGKTFYLTDIVLTDAGFAAGVEIRGVLKVAGTEKIDFHVQAGSIGHISLRTPVKATSAQVVLLQGDQWSGSDKRMSGNLIGFEV